VSTLILRLGDIVTIVFLSFRQKVKKKRFKWLPLGEKNKDGLPLNEFKIDDKR